MSWTYRILSVKLGSRDETRQEETKGQTDSGKARLEAGKARAYGAYPSRFGTLGRFERQEGAREGACT
jgi:hypothetical protein